jgi:2C-methyl-D-erythritol 2,4-cyclodiphosphate synthase
METTENLLIVTPRIIRDRIMRLITICVIIICTPYHLFSQIESKSDSIIHNRLDTYSSKSQKVDTVIQPKQKQPITFKWKSKIILHDNTTVRNPKGWKINFDDHALILEDSKIIPISDIKRIRVYRNPMLKTIGVSAAAGMLFGLGADELKEADSDDGEESYSYFGQGLVAGTAIGIVISPISLIATKQHFTIDGSTENFKKMIELLGPEDWF